jgi:flagellar basal-body rod protein FlgG
MIYGFYNSAAGAIVNAARVDVIANNLANVNTVGFRKDYMITEQRPSEAIERGRYRFREIYCDAMGGGTFVTRTYFDRDPGLLRETGNPLDVAIDGEGFFKISKNGRTYYTRAGNFKLDKDGMLRTADGEGYVLNADGSPIRILAPASAVSIGSKGQVYVNEELVANLWVVDLFPLNGVHKHGQTMFVADAQVQEMPFNGRVLHRWLEGSSANPVREMVELISAIRAFEINMRMISIQDGTVERAANDLGRIPG